MADRPFPEPNAATIDEARNLANKRQAQCSSCGRVFASVSSFDAQARWTRRVVTCLRSTVIPRLLLRPDGVWGRADQHPAEAAGAHAEVDA